MPQKSRTRSEQLNGRGPGAVNRRVMELFSRRRWATWLAQQSNNYGIIPCMCCIKPLKFNINTTTFCLGWSSLHLLLLMRPLCRGNHVGATFKDNILAITSGQPYLHPTIVFYDSSYHAMTWNLQDVATLELQISFVRLATFTFFLKKLANPGLFYHLSFIFSNKHHSNFYNKYMGKMSIQYTVPGFKPTTFRTWYSSHNH